MFRVFFPDDCVESRDVLDRIWAVGRFPWLSLVGVIRLLMLAPEARQVIDRCKGLFLKCTLRNFLSLSCWAFGNLVVAVLSRPNLAGATPGPNCFDQELGINNFFRAMC